jgi:hypothetical protein
MNENFGTFSSRQQPWSKLHLPFVINMGNLVIKHNGKSEIKFAASNTPWTLTLHRVG